MAAACGHKAKSLSLGANSQTWIARACMTKSTLKHSQEGKEGRGRGVGVIVHRGGRVQSANKRKVADRAESRIILCRALASSEMSPKSRSDNNSPPIFPTPLFNPVQRCQPLLPPPASIFSQCQANNATDIPNSAVPQLMGRWKRLFSCRLAASMSQPDRNDGNVSGEGQGLSLNIPPDITGHRVPDRLDRRRAAVTLGSSQPPFASILFQSLVGKSASTLFTDVFPDLPGQCVYFWSPLSLPSVGLNPHSSTHKPSCSSRAVRVPAEGPS